MNERDRLKLVKEIKQALPQPRGWHSIKARPSDLAWEEHSDLHEFSTEPDRKTFEKIKKLSEFSDPE